MNIKKGRSLELFVTDMAFGGKGIARIDNMPVFVDQAVPGDKVTVRITKKKKQYAEARIINLDEPSALRIDPPCRYSGFCGGCKWQFLPYEKQLAFKQSHVRESIEHIGLLKGVDVLPVIPSELVYGYRNKMEFSFADRPWLLPEEMETRSREADFALGLHVPGTFHKVLDIDSCLLMPDTGNGILAHVSEYARNSGVPAYGLRSHEGFWRFLVLRHSVSRDRWLVNLVTASERPDVTGPLAASLMESFPEISGVVNNVTARKAGVAFGEYEVLIAGNPVLIEETGPYTFEISANSFFQTNTLGAKRLYDTVKAYAGLSGKETLLDLYCGTGTIGIFLSDSARSVIGMEIVESAIRDAEKNCLKNGIKNCRFIAGDIRNLLSDMPAPDVMVIDPPRSGMHKDVVRKIMEMGPERIVYVSCNPSTFARDLLVMKELYDLPEVQPVDMFPHTWHIECVGKLEKK